MLDQVAYEYQLTPREKEIMLLIAEGLSNKEIAERINVAEGTVKVHASNIYKKLNISRRSQVSALLNLAE